MFALIALSTRFAREFERCAASAFALSAAVAGHAAMILRRRRTYIALSKLDGRTLRDIGLDRTMIMSVAAEGVRTAKEAEHLLAPPDGRSGQLIRSALPHAGAPALCSLERLQPIELKKLSMEAIRSSAEAG